MTTINTFFQSDVSTGTTQAHRETVQTHVFSADEFVCLRQVAVPSLSVTPLPVCLPWRHHGLLVWKRKTPEEMLRQNQRLTRAMRDLDRERQRLEQQEKKIIADIKKMAKQGQMDAVKIMAKDLVRTRHYVKKFIMMRANIQAVSLKIQTLKSNNSMAQAMKGVTKAMGTMNRQLKLPQIQKIMMEFEKQSEIMDMKEEMMNDAIDDAMGDEDDEEER
ncbi:charged multivesicular body protein 2a [Acipenser oxyrinchus oxyrinchus]|uniref:Charged multivesicular body protein 2a n=1 Tax=Acipenser oxyrinchus oxyrinchus TaxID=40147 RepID=A0AAD8FQQ4_ACIOX|nr:charged multivesicular body protein 2a [Acipenser oxyrinchus oxyrinchus]